MRRPSSWREIEREHILPLGFIIHSRGNRIRSSIIDSISLFIVLLFFVFCILKQTLSLTHGLTGCSHIHHNHNDDALYSLAWQARSILFDSYLWYAETLCGKKEVLLVQHRANEQAVTTGQYSIMPMSPSWPQVSRSSKTLSKSRYIQGTLAPVRATSSSTLSLVSSKSVVARVPLGKRKTIVGAGHSSKTTSVMEDVQNPVKRNKRHSHCVPASSRLNENTIPGIANLSEHAMLEMLKYGGDQKNVRIARGFVSDKESSHFTSKRGTGSEAGHPHVASSSSSSRALKRKVSAKWGIGANTVDLNDTGSSSDDAFEFSPFARSSAVRKKTPKRVVRIDDEVDDDDDDSSCEATNVGMDEAVVSQQQSPQKNDISSKQPQPAPASGNSSTILFLRRDQKKIVRRPSSVPRGFSFKGEYSSIYERNGHISIRGKKFVPVRKAVSPALATKHCMQTTVGEGPASIVPGMCQGVRENKPNTLSSSSPVTTRGSAKLFSLDPYLQNSVTEGHMTLEEAISFSLGDSALTPGASTEGLHSTPSETPPASSSQPLPTFDFPCSRAKAKPSEEPRPVPAAGDVPFARSDKTRPPLPTDKLRSTRSSSRACVKKGKLTEDLQTMVDQQIVTEEEAWSMMIVDNVDRFSGSGIDPPEKTNLDKEAGAQSPKRDPSRQASAKHPGSCSSELLDRETSLRADEHQREEDVYYDTDEDGWSNPSPVVDSDGDDIDLFDDADGGNIIPAHAEYLPYLRTIEDIQRGAKLLRGCLEGTCDVCKTSQKPKHLEKIIEHVGQFGTKPLQPLSASTSRRNPVEQPKFKHLNKKPKSRKRKSSAKTGGRSGRGRKATANAPRRTSVTRKRKPAAKAASRVQSSAVHLSNHSATHSLSSFAADRFNDSHVGYNGPRGRAFVGGTGNEFDDLGSNPHGGLFEGRGGSDPTGGSISWEGEGAIGLDQ